MVKTIQNNDIIIGLIKDIRLVGIVWTGKMKHFTILI